MNKVLVSPDFLKVLFFWLVGLGYAISSLAWPRRQLRLLCRYPPWDFFLRPKKKRSPLRRLLWRLLSSIENFWRVNLEQVYCFANFALVILGFWAPLAFHNCWGIQFSDGIIIIIIFSINVKALLPSVVRYGWMIALTQISAVLRKEGPLTD